MNTSFFSRATRTILAAALLTATSAAAPTRADAQSVSQGESGNTITEFGASNIVAVGQSFVALGDALSSFSFFLVNEELLGVATGLSPEKVTFTAYVAAWDGSAIAGPWIYQSGPQTGPTLAFSQYVFATGGIAVTKGGSYLAFLRINSDSPSDASAALNLSDDNAVNGYAFASTASDLTANDSWFLVQDTQFAFAAEFTTTQVPEPTTAVLTLVGLAGIAVRARRRTS